MLCHLPHLHCGIVVLCMAAIGLDQQTQRCVPHEINLLAAWLGIPEENDEIYCHCALLNFKDDKLAPLGTMI